MIPDSTAQEIEQVLAAAALAAGPFGALTPAERAGLLRRVADDLDAAADELVGLAQEESHLPEPRLRGELTRTTFQLRLFAETLEEGTYLEAIIDGPDPDWGMGPRPDLRRMLVPLGPAVVFAASNFPFAFSVAGGDTASALAAGCPVIVKAHPGHPRLSRRTADIVAAALPDGVFGIVFGFEAGPAVLRDERVKVGAFTGSIPAGRALYDLAASRPEPIPFYGELGSLNPVFVTEAAAKARADDIATGFVSSYTLGAGQFCTKPGLLFVPAGSGLLDAIGRAAGEAPAAPMLNDRIRDGYVSGLGRLKSVPGVEVVREGSSPEAPSLLATTVSVLAEQRDALLEECFGPVSIVVEYDGADELLDAAALFSGNLTATVHGEDEDVDSGLVRPLVELLRDRAGRLLWNGWPTGVSVTYAMQHGGPWPATTASVHTSVGTTAIRRFLRPVAYQSFPQALLPEALRDDNPLGVPRRTDVR
ncbi:MAG TPA: aldehyde dehydrogenase (NADP(+)) [Actinopolymorphaceae bacterium]